MAVNDDTNMIVGASIIIPLKKTAYLDFCEGSLDALKIKASHIAGVSEKQDQRFLLVDMLCRHPQLSSAFSGIAFRSLIRHIALFYEPLKQKPPVIFCSTENKKLLSRLDALEFERGAKELNTEAYIYSTDLGKQQFKSPQVRAYYTHLIELCRFYNQENSI
jgi:hypothetical protein